MSTLRRSAEGGECDLRYPLICSFDRTTVVLAHLNMGGLAGMGMKAPDVCAVRACDACHAVLDGKVRHDMEPGDFWKWTLEGHLRTLKWWQERGYLAVRAG